MYKFLRLSTYILKTKHEFKYTALNMSSHKRISDGLNSNSPSKVCRVKSDSNQYTQPTCVVETLLLNKIEMHSVEVMETPDKSENDKKSYRVIRLKNGLKALLISDPTQKSAPHEDAVKSDALDAMATISEDEEETESDDEQSDDEVENGSHGEKRGKLAACSLCVDVGSFSDPRQIQGLAHFLEHMIFMGSEKYPNENEFDQFMQKAGGFDNADTDFDETSFYFETREEFLDDALDRFSQFFKAPLMLKEAMTREREAVESEFASKKNGEDVRRGQLISSLGSPLHPSSIFAWGNLETLKDNIADDVLYEKVHEFRKRHYSAHRMYLCLQSNSSLDDLQEMANRHFSTIPNNQMPGDDFSKFTHHNAFQSKFYEKVYFVKPIGNISKIDITWCLWPMIENFKCKPDQYLSHILGHEGKGSLLSYFRKKLWAVDLAAGTDNSGMGSTKLFSLFNICVYLTEDGFDHLDEVLFSIFSYLKLLQLNGPKESIFREIQTIEANAFRFANERDALDNVEDVVISLKQYPPKYILTGDCLFFEYDANAIQQIIDELNSSKFNIMITSTRRFSENITYEQTENWFGTMYTEIDMPEKWLSLWKNATPLSEFALPEPNKFIADDFTILYEEGQTIPMYPMKILDNDLCELWFRQDDKFLLPTACYNFYFMTPDAIATIEDMIQMTLLATLLKYQFVEKLYPATCAGLEYSCYAADLGLVLKVSGFNQKLHLIVDVFSKCLKSLADDTTEKQFEVFVEQLFKTYENIFLRPKVLAKELRLNIIESHHQPLYEKNQRLRSITFSDFQQFCRKYCEKVKIKAIMQGNLTEDRALNIMHNVLNELNCGKVEDLSLIELRTTKLPVGANYLRCKTFHPKDVNTVITNFYQIGTISYRTHVLIDLLVWIAQEPLFDMLRNKEQLAYDVSFDLRDNYGILGYSITVNSQESKFSADHVDERIENFRRELITIIETMPEDDFEAIKASLSKIKLNEDNKLSEEVTRNWAEITTDEYEFDRQHKEVDYLSTITKAQLLEFYRTYYGNAERKLSVQIIGSTIGNGQGKESDVIAEFEKNGNLETRRKQFDALNYVDFNGEPKGNLIEDLMQFKTSLEVYSVTKTNRRLV
ncbi:nardilysin-like [Contarinia nasturtii]|uniref:nardilysin-like n=1 Tax=Contarinia nasturtii TaxID=265458 RepID=UPI0012D45B5F|nr:nardilysin-like [Contarinia nasturtii]